MSPRQQAFVEHYLRCWNASEAARQAGYTGKANVVGPRLLANVSIAAAIQARLDELRMGADEVLVRLAEQARFNPLRFMVIRQRKDDDATSDVAYEEVGIDLAGIQAAGLGSCVKKLSYDKFGRLVVEFYDAQAALRLIGQHHQLFTQLHVVETPDLKPLPEALRELAARVYGAMARDEDQD